MEEEFAPGWARGCHATSVCYDCTEFQGLQDLYLQRAFFVYSTLHIMYVLNTSLAFSQHRRKLAPGFQDEIAKLYLIHTELKRTRTGTGIRTVLCSS